jgi:hypothetical protein
MKPTFVHLVCVSFKESDVSHTYADMVEFHMSPVLGYIPRIQLHHAVLGRTPAFSTVSLRHS